MSAERTDWLRMVGWLLAGLSMYLFTVFVGAANPMVQTVFYKMGHVTTLAWVGYWLARGALGRLDTDSENHPIEYLARAVLMGAVILGGSMGL